MPWTTYQGTVKSLTHGKAYASLMAQQLDNRLASADLLQKVAQFHMAYILSVDEELHNLFTFAFVALYLFSMARHHASAVAEILRLIDR